MESVRKTSAALVWNAEEASLPGLQGKSVELAPVSGVGIHTGRLTRLRVRGWAEGSESPFFSHVSNGLDHSAPALWTRLSATSRSTSLVLRGASRRRFELKTVEHLLAAAFAAGLPPLVFEIEGLSPAVDPRSEDVLEVPALDGSAAEWCEWIAPCVHECADRPVWLPVRSFQLVDGPKSVLIAPAADPALAATTLFRCSVDFQNVWKQQSSFRFDWTKVVESFRRFRSEIAAARTFGFQHELASLGERKLAIGGSLKNALLLDGDRVVNPEGFRQPNELADHKLLDAVGDFALLGAPVLGEIHAVQAGHSMHLRTLEEAVRTGALVKARLVGGRIERV
jgi:UDP-3-O-[3-hydroxymyristoyl] N-acetylglucosamine deacetylase